MEDMSLYVLPPSLSIQPSCEIKVSDRSKPAHLYGGNEKKK